MVIHYKFNAVSILIFIPMISINSFIILFSIDSK